MRSRARGRQALVVGQSREWKAQRRARHSEVEDNLARKICRDLGIADP
jgi:hypothetical protein